MPRNSIKNPQIDDANEVGQKNARKTQPKVAAAPTPSKKRPLQSKKSPPAKKISSRSKLLVDMEATEQTADIKARVNLKAMVPLKCLLALGVEVGLFVVLAVAKEFDSIIKFARYVGHPLPHLIAVSNSSWIGVEKLDAAVIYGGFIPLAEQPSAGLMKIGAITSAGLKPVFEVDCLPWRTAPQEVMTEIFQRFSKFLAPGFEAELPVEHPLRRASARLHNTKPLSSEHSRVGLPPISTLRGNFDGVIEGMAHGWVFDPTKIGHRLPVEVMCGDEIVARGEADLYRADLLENGIGDGEYHFRLKISRELFDGHPHDLWARVANSSEVLPGSHTATLPKLAPSKYDRMPRKLMIPAAKALLLNNDATDKILALLDTAGLSQELGSLDEAELLYNEAAKVGAPLSIVKLKLAEVSVERNDIDNAMKSYGDALKVDPEFKWAHLGIANIEKEEGKISLAYSAYRRALEIDELFAEARLGLANILPAFAVYCANQLIKDDRMDEALKFLAAAFVQAPSDKVTKAAILNILAVADPVDESMLSAAARQTLAEIRLFELIFNNKDFVLKPEYA